MRDISFVEAMRLTPQDIRILMRQAPPMRARLIRGLHRQVAARRLLKRKTVFSFFLQAKVSHLRLCVHRAEGAYLPQRSTCSL